MADEKEDEGFEFTDMEAKMAQAKMTERHAKEDVTLEELDDEPPESDDDFKIEGGDTDWAEPKEGADLEYTADKEEETEEEVEEEKAEKKEEVSAEDKKLQESYDEFIKYMEDEGGGTKYIVKGKEYDLRDLSPQEWRDRQSKADRFYQGMEELAAQRKELEQRERLAETAARQTQEFMRKYDTREAQKVDIPDLYKPQEDDTETERALKQGYAELYTTVKNLERGYQQQTEAMGRNELDRQLDILVREYPMASKEEIVAVKYNYPDADLRVIAENSHNQRISDQYIDSVLQARPDRLREIKEKAIEEHLAKKQKATKVARKKSSSTVSSKASSATKKTPRTFDEIEANYDNMIRGYEKSIQDMED